MNGHALDFPVFCPACGAALTPPVEACKPRHGACRHCGLRIHAEPPAAKPKRKNIDNKELFKSFDLGEEAIIRDCSLSDTELHADAPVPALVAIDRLAIVDDPGQQMLLWRRALQPGGLLYLEVPAEPDVKARWQARWVFSRRSLMLLAERTGFRLIARTRRTGALGGWFRRY